MAVNFSVAKGIRLPMMTNAIFFVVATTGIFAQAGQKPPAAAAPAAPAAAPAAVPAAKPAAAAPAKKPDKGKKEEPIPEPPKETSWKSRYVPAIGALLAGGPPLSGTSEYLSLGLGAELFGS